MQKATRSFGLDLARCCAIVLVMVNHSYLFLPEFKHKWVISFLSGFLGVELFFSLSGFLIGTILVKMVNSQAGAGWGQLVRFWVRRWFRTIPIYWIALAVYCICWLVFRYPEFGKIGPGELLRYLIFSQNLVSMHPAFFGIAWSLSIEEWFYLVFPFVLVVLLKLNPDRKIGFLITIGIFILTAFAIRLEIYKFLLQTGQWQTYDWDAGMRKLVIFRLDATVYGVLLAYLNFHYRVIVQTYRKWLTIAGLICLMTGYSFFVSYTAASQYNLYSVVLLFPLVNLGFALLMPALLEIRKGERYKRLSGLIERISLISYSVYLFHYTVLCFFTHFFSEKLGPELKIILLIGFWAITYFLSGFSYDYLERPILRLRDRIAGREKGAQAIN